MSLGRIFSPRGVSNGSPKLSDHAESSFAPADERFGGSKTKARTRVDLRSVVQRRFMSMMEAHDRMRERLLGLPQKTRHTVSGD
jgi:hypothetical protein